MGRLIVSILAIGNIAGTLMYFRLLREFTRDFERDSIENSMVDVVEHEKDEHIEKYEDQSVADELAKKVRVLCWVMTQPSNHEKKAKHVKATWGKRCNTLLFMSTAEDNSLPTVKLPVREGSDNLWAKVKAAFIYVYTYHRNDADWFLRADDDTYVIMENLRYMLSDYDSENLIYFGCRFKPFSRQGFMSGGAGIMLSKSALDKLVEVALHSPWLCQIGNRGIDDVNLGICLNNIGVEAVDTRDLSHRGRFFPFLPQNHLFPNPDKNYWYWKYLYYPADEGLDCCSEYAISFHYVNGVHMHLYDYLIYRLRPTTIVYTPSEKHKLMKGNETNEVVTSLIKV